MSHVGSQSPEGDVPDLVVLEEVLQVLVKDVLGIVHHRLLDAVTPFYTRPVYLLHLIEGALKLTVAPFGQWDVLRTLQQQFVVEVLGLLLSQ